MLTLAEINAATGDTLGRLGVRVQDAAYEDQRAANLAYGASLGRQEAELVKQTAALERQAAALEATAKVQLNKKQQAFFDLYATHLKTRRDPAVITSATHDTVVKDIALDAMMMTNEVWPLFKQAMASMEVPPGGVDWS